MPSVPTSSAPVALREPRARGGGGGDEAAARRAHRRILRLNRLTPWLFLAPALAFFSVFKFWPSIWGVYLSFFHVRPYLGDQYVGFENFHRAFTDPDLRAAVGHTVLDAVVAVVGSMLVGFLLALLLEGPARHVRVLRTAVFLPAVTAMVAVAELWGALLFPGRYGAVNSVLGDLGLGTQPFLSSPDSALWTVMLVQIWKSAPYDMVIFIAGLVGIDKQLYESASIDGANAWQRLRAVTLPSLRPITTIVLTLGAIRGIRVFTEIYVLTGGGPGGATESVVTTIYKTTVVSNDAGYAAAISTLLLATTIILTCLLLWWRNRREAA
jgi:multiple sugar transport system permease protein